MANITFSKSAHVYDLMEDQVAITRFTSTQVELENLGFRLVLTGTGLSATGSGTITGFSLYSLDVSTGTTATTLVASSTSPLTLSLSGLKSALDAGMGIDFLFGGNDVIQGSTGDDYLFGFNGSDRLYGNDGDDSLYGDSWGSDTIGGADTLVGGNGNDYLDGGAGADSMVGGIGNDTYLVNTATDKVVESAGQGLDTVQVQAGGSLTSYSLPANVEDLKVSPSYSYTPNPVAFTAKGNSLHNKIGLTWDYNTNDQMYGLGGNDRISSGKGDDLLSGGAGKDTLFGGTGLDSFVFDAALSATTNVDTIKDFKAVDDVIKLENTGTGLFNALVTLGPLDPTAFRSGAGVTTAGDSTDRIIYNTRDGSLYYDADGTGAAVPVLFAKLELSGVPATGITAADFVVI